jgi:hypothetical protein
MRIGLPRVYMIGASISMVALGGVVVSRPGVIGPAARTAGIVLLALGTAGLLASVVVLTARGGQGDDLGAGPKGEDR